MILPGCYVRGRVSGYSFSTRGTNLQVNLIRQRSVRRLDWTFGPLVNLRSDRSGRVKDDQVDALGKRKLAVEAGFSAGVPYRSEEHTSELQSLMRMSYAVFCLNKKRWLPSTLVRKTPPLNSSP